MPPYQAPGVYVEEVPGRVRSIEPAATSVAAMVGVADRGPVLTPTLVTSVTEFGRVFGGPPAAGDAPPDLAHLPHAARGFFANGGQRLRVVRIVGPAATRSNVDVTGPAPDEAPVLRVHARSPGIWGDALRIRTATTATSFDLTVERLDGALIAESEHFAALSLDPTNPRYAPAIIGSLDGPEASATSRLIRLSDPAAGQLPAAREWPLAGGTDDIPSITDTTFTDGIRALESAPEISLVAAPGITAPAVQQALLDHAHAMRFRFAVLDAPSGASVSEAIDHRRLFDRPNGAIYHPWILTADVPAGVPPCGHVMGVIARSDTTRGVWKAPANDSVADATGFADTLTHGEHELLNPAHVNALRDFRATNRGLRVYGARTLSTDAEWRYISVRRLLLHIEQSLDAGLQWAVFEPNAEPLWVAARAAAADFLTALWRNGGLAGAKPQEAFFVQAALHQTMTQADVDAGRLILVIGVAPTKPAEFTVIRLTLPTQPPG